MTQQWKLVPVEPTPKMIDATWNDSVDRDGGIESQNTRNRRIYTAMVNAAPTPPASAQDDAKVYHFEQRSRFGPWIEVETPTERSVEFVQRAAAPAAGDALDAARWRAFIGCARIRPLGSAGLEQPDPNNYAHMGLEIWTVYGRDYSPELLKKMDAENERGRRWLVMFADVARAALAAQVPQQGEA